MLLHLGPTQGVKCESKVLNLYIGLVHIYKYLFSENVKLYMVIYYVDIVYVFLFNEYYYVKKVI